MPQFGLGLWQMSKDNCANIVYESIKKGYRMLDSAEIYANEA
jgi:diketogulonate reductase-like aldo/keto reductase